MPNIQHEKTLSHPAYHIYSPQPSWTDRPGSLLYVKKSIKADQLFLAQPDPDLTVVKLSSDHQHLTVISIYNPPERAERRGEALGQIGSLPEHQNAIVCGDFNMHHAAWDENATDGGAEAEAFNNWLSDTGYILLNPPYSPTHERGAVLDLSLASPSLFRKNLCQATVRYDLSVGSDHEVIVTSVTGAPAHPAPEPTMFNTKKLDTDIFQRECRRQQKKLEAGLVVTRPHDVEHLARTIVTAVTLALEKSCPKKSRTGASGYQWWNTECQEAAKQHRESKRASQLDPFNTASIRSRQNFESQPASSGPISQEDLLR